MQEKVLNLNVYYFQLYLLSNFNKINYHFKKIIMSESNTSNFNTIIFVIVLVVLAFTNPSQEKHIQEANTVLKKVVNGISSKGLMDNGNSNNQLMGGLGLLFGDGLVDGMTRKFITRKNYIFFSLANASFDGKDQTIGIGILGNVVIFDEFEKTIKATIERSKNKLNEGTNWNNNSNNNSSDAYNALSESNNQSSSNPPERNASSTQTESNEYYVNASTDNHVHFYSSPDINSKRNAYFDTRERVTSLKTENGFIYVDFTNTENQHSEGWISLNDLTKAN